GRGEAAARGARLPGAFPPPGGGGGIARKRRPRCRRQRSRDTDRPRGRHRPRGISAAGKRAADGCVRVVLKAEYLPVENASRYECSYSLVARYFSIGSIPIIFFTHHNQTTRSSKCNCYILVESTRGMDLCRLARCV